MKNNDRRPYRVNGKEVVVDAENVNYTGIDNVENVADALDYLKGHGGGSGGGGSTESYTGKVFGVLGDSFTQANKWQKRMCDNLRATLIGAGGASVGGISGGRYGGDDSTKWALTQAQALYAYCSTNNVTPDYILVCDGTNDVANLWSDGGNQMGVFDPSATVSDIGTSLVIDKGHLVAGMQAAFLYLKDKFPNAIILASNTPGGWLHTSTSTYDGYCNCLEENLKMVCKHYGIEFMDAYYCIPPGATNVDNSGHPTDTGHQRIGDYMAALLLSRLI